MTRDQQAAIEAADQPADTNSAAEVRQFPGITGACGLYSEETGTECAHGSTAGGNPASEKVDVSEVEFDVHVSMRYHARRRAWFDGLHRGSMALSAIGGSGALTSLLAASGQVSPNTWAMWISFAVTVVGATSLAFGFSDRARLADSLYKRFTELAHDIAVEAYPNSLKIRQWEGKRLLIEADEPTPLRTLVILCQNAEARSRDRGDHIFKVHWWQYVCANIIHLPPDGWELIGVSGNHKA